jgi:hypothetical protein
LVEGSVEGKLEGSVEGKLEGLVEGSVEGKLEGSVEGKLEGLVEGSVEGSLEGLVEGSLERVVRGFRHRVAGRIHRIRTWSRRGRGGGVGLAEAAPRRKMQRLVINRSCCPPHVKKKMICTPSFYRGETNARPSSYPERRERRGLSHPTGMESNV